MALTHDDDAALHQVTDDSSWRESYYLNFFAADSDLHGLAYQAVTPNRGKGEAYFVVFDGDEPLLWSVDDAVTVPPDVGAERMAPGNQRFVCEESWRRWRAEYDGPEGELAVSWERLSDVCDWNWGALTGSVHLQHAGRIRCRGRIGDREIDFSGFGERDRAWGPRKWSAIDLSWFLVAQFPDETAVHAFVHRSEGVYHLMGYLHRDGHTEDLAGFEASDIVYSPGGGPVESVALEFTDVTGRSVRVRSVERYRDYLAFAATGGAGLSVQPANGTYEGPRMFLTFQRFVRDDGVVGKGMIDNNLTADVEATRFAAAGPVGSQLYVFDEEVAR